MSKIVEIDCRSKEQKWADFKEGIRNKIHAGAEWITNHKEIVIVFTPIIIKGVTTITKVVAKSIIIGKQRSLKDLYCYDRSLGHYWKLRRELTNREWLEIDRRRKQGERLADILSDMRVLK